MKKIIILLSFILLIVGCSSNSKGNANTFGYDEIKNSNHNIKKVDVKEIKERIKNKESFELFIGRTSCSHCHDQIGDFAKRSAKDKNLNMLYYDFEPGFILLTKGVEKDKEEEAEAVAAELQYLSEEFGFEFATPTIYKFDKGVLVKEQ